jgi:hypothetical protein
LFRYGAVQKPKSQVRLADRRNQSVGCIRMTDSVEQKAIAEIMRKAAPTLIKMRDAMRDRGFAILHQFVSHLEKRHGQASA